MAYLSEHRTRLALRPLSLARKLRAVLVLRRQRRTLARLDETVLRDIGISRKAAQAEARRPFWDVPDTWRES